MLQGYEMAAPLLRIREVTGSNRGPAILTKGFHGFPQSLQADDVLVS
jgi:hypothetical protein